MKLILSGLAILIILSITGWLGRTPTVYFNASSLFAIEEGQAKSDSEKTKPWEAFELTDLEKQRDQNNRPYLRFLDRSTLSMGVYFLPKDGKDEQQPHKLDEVYYISGGKAVLQVDGEDISVQPGSIIFVAANVAHHFHSISEDLTVLVFFSTANTAAKE